MLPQCHHISTAVFQFWGSILGCFQTQTRHKFEMLRTSLLSKPSLSCKHVAAVSRRGNCTPLPSSAKGGEFILFDWKMGISKDWRFPTVSFAAWPYTACIDLHLFETAGNKVELLGPGQWTMIFQWQVSFFFVFSWILNGVLYNNLVSRFALALCECRIRARQSFRARCRPALVMLMLIKLKAIGWTCQNMFWMLNYIAAGKNTK